MRSDVLIPFSPSSLRIALRSTRFSILYEQEILRPDQKVATDLSRRQPTRMNQCQHPTRGDLQFSRRLAGADKVGHRVGNYTARRITIQGLPGFRSVRPAR